MGLAYARWAVEQQAPLEVLPCASSRSRWSATPTTCRRIVARTSAGRMTSSALTSGRVWNCSAAPRSPNMSWSNEITWPRKTLWCRAEARTSPAILAARPGLSAATWRCTPALPLLRVTGQHQKRGVHVTLNHQVQSRADRLTDLTLRPAGQVGPGHGAGEGTVLVVLQSHQVPEPEAAMTELGEPHQSVVAIVFRKPGVEADLHVHLVIRRPRLLHHLDVVDAAEVRGEQLWEGRSVIGARGADDAAPRPTGELAEVGEPQPVVGLCHRRRPATPSTRSRRSCSSPSGAWVDHASRAGM